MSHNQKIKLRYNDTSKAQYNAQQNKFTEILKKSVKDFTKWPAKKQMLAIGAVGAIFFTALPVLLYALPLALPGAVIALTLFFTVKAISYAVKGIGWSAEKIVEGTKYSAKKVEEGADYLGQKTKDGFNYTVDSLKRGTGEILYNTASRLYNAAGETNYLEKIKEFTREQKNQSQEIRGELKEIFDNKKNSADLVVNILSGIVSKINLKIEEEKSSGWIEHTDKWKEQRKFINKLDAGKLQSLLTQRSLPKDSYFIDSIFSEHHSEIKKVIAERKENHSLPDISKTLPGVKKMFEREESTENRKNKEQRPRLTSSTSENSSLNSVSTKSSTAQLLNSQKHKEVKPTTSVKEKVELWFGRNKEQEVEVASELKYQALSDSDSILGANCSRSNSLTKIEATKVSTISDSLSQDVSMLLAQVNKDVSGYSNSTNSFSSASDELMSNNSSLTRSTSSFSFHDSGPKKPPRTYQYSSNPFMEELTTTLKRRNSAPFSQITVEAVVHQQPRATQNKLS